MKAIIVFLALTSALNAHGHEQDDEIRQEAVRNLYYLLQGEFSLELSNIATLKVCTYYSIATPLYEAIDVELLSVAEEFTQRWIGSNSVTNQRIGKQLAADFDVLYEHARLRLDGYIDGHEEVIKALLIRDGEEAARTICDNVVEEANKYIREHQ